MLGGFQGGADFRRGFFRDRAGHEVDHAANVLWSVTHGAGTAYHVDAVEVARGNRCHGQLRLTVRRERGGDAVNQHSGAWRQARRQAAHTNVQGNVAATGAVGVLHLHAGDAFEHITDVHRALFDHGFAANHGPSARMVLHHGSIRIAEPVADHLDVGHAQFQRTVGRRGRC
ncbi:hypothetical protein D3C84_590900 [compost metagenome]